jgi:FtsP/CotA-like multicopper oxidase with cupredoxin domain
MNRTYKLKAFLFLIVALQIVRGAGDTTRVHGDTQGTEVSRFESELTVPPLLERSVSDSGLVEMDLNAGEGSKTFLKGVRTPTLGYNGSYLGPTIRTTRGERILINVENSLDEVTTVHWHGLHVPAEMDGGPHQRINPGEIWKPTFTVNQNAATLWYHPHPLGKTGEQVYRGLAGLFIVEDEISRSLPVPKNYGVDDIPLIIQDRRFFSDGSFAYVRGMPDVMHGVIGDLLLVNGDVRPYLEVGRNLVRFRALNGSNSSIYRVRLSDESRFHQIASDGGFLEKPVSMTHLVLSAGERAEILIDFSQYGEGSRLVLIVDEINGASFQALQIRVTGQGHNRLAVPSRLTKVEPIPVSNVAKTRRFVMQTMGRGGRLSINGRKMNMGRIDEVVKLGDTEIWEVSNRSMGMMQLPHSFHIHDVQVQILSRDGKKPPENERGWKDTFIVWPGEVVRFAAVFEDYTGIYMYHCHFLEHEDDGMMGQFEVSATLPAGQR